MGVHSGQPERWHVIVREVCHDDCNGCNLVVAMISMSTCRADRDKCQYTMSLYCKIMGKMSPGAWLSAGTAAAIGCCSNAHLGSVRPEHSTARLATWSFFQIFAPALQTQFVTICKGSTLVFLIYLRMRSLLKSKIKSKDRNGSHSAICKSKPSALTQAQELLVHSRHSPALLTFLHTTSLFWQVPVNCAPVATSRLSPFA